MIYISVLSLLTYTTIPKIYTSMKNNHDFEHFKLYNESIKKFGVLKYKNEIEKLPNSLKSLTFTYSFNQKK